MNHVSELDIVIRQKGNKVVAGIPQIGLYAKAETVSLALAELEAKKSALVADLEEAGELDSLRIDKNLATNQIGTGGPRNDLRFFAAKVGIVVSLVMVGFVVSSLLIVAKVEKVVINTTDQIKSIKVGGSQFWSNVEAGIDRMASPISDLPEDKKKKLLNDIHVIASRWRPFLDEIQTSLVNPTHESQGVNSPAKR